MLPKTVSDPCGVYNVLQVLLEQYFFGEDVHLPHFFP